MHGSTNVQTVRAFQKTWTLSHNTDSGICVPMQPTEKDFHGSILFSYNNVICKSFS